MNFGGAFGIKNPKLAKLSLIVSKLRSKNAEENSQSNIDYLENSNLPKWVKGTF